MELLLEGFHRTISLFLIDDYGRSSLRRALSNQADTDLRRLKGTEDTSIDPRPSILRPSKWISAFPESEANARTTLSRGWEVTSVPFDSSP